MPKNKYDKSITTGEVGRRLHQYWIKKRKVSNDPIFEQYESFYAWALESGYKAGARLMRRDSCEPYNTSNCFWMWDESMCPQAEKQIEQKARAFRQIRAWDEAVNRIRQHYGMEPIRSSEVYYVEAQ